MKRADAQREIERHLAPLFPDFYVHGDLLIAHQGSVLRGFAVERSQIGCRDFRLRAFAQVLTIPLDHIIFDVVCTGTRQLSRRCGC